MSISTLINTFITVTASYNSTGTPHKNLYNLLH